MSYQKKGYWAGKNDKGYYANRPKGDGLFGTSFGQTHRNKKAQESFDKGWSKGRKNRKYKGWF